MEEQVVLAFFVINMLESVHQMEAQEAEVVTLFCKRMLSYLIYIT